jgi:hypothetical protein
VLKITFVGDEKPHLYEFRNRKETMDWVSLFTLFLLFLSDDFVQTNKLAEMKKKYTWIKNYTESVLTDEVGVRENASFQFPFFSDFSFFPLKELERSAMDATSALH